MAEVYEVTASKRRPKTFDELAGQEFVVSTLKNSLRSGHIAHAYLFSGPRGCGKTSAARILARSLNCSAANSNAVDSGDAGNGGRTDGGGSPCGVCDNCRAISQGASMDVLEIDGASNNSVNDVRQIRDEVLFPPQTGRYKVYIIDEVHMLSGSAFNALLKTIEEPPPYIVFIFATTELHKVPATIKSRCQQFNFRLIPIETIQEILKKICAETGIQAEDEALFWIAKESTGSMRDAFTLFDQVVSFSGGVIRSELIRKKLGLVGLEKLNALAQACAANDVPGAFALTDEIIGCGVAIEQFVIDLAGYYRSLLLMKNGITRESLLGYKPSLFSGKVLEALDSIRLEQALEILLDCYRDIRYSLSPRFELETAVSKLSWLSRWASPAELKDAVEKAQSVLRNARIDTPAAAPPAKEAAGSSANAPSPSGAAVSSRSPEPPKPPPSSSAPQYSDEGRSLSADFKRMIAAKENDAQDDEDVPLWDRVVQKDESQPNQTALHSSTAPHASAAPESPLVDRFLSKVPGIIVE